MPSSRATGNVLAHKPVRLSKAQSRVAGVGGLYASGVSSGRSYDRTDPFTAFSALLSLIGSLPTRKGGNQFKFTPEEYALAIHLLNIVEPFISIAPSLRRTFVRQPTEILDAIAFHLDSKHDLLNLAKTCKRLHSIVFPRHFDYRVIKCKASSARVWNHLLIHRSLARNVRHLEILDERSSLSCLIPGGIRERDTELESTDDELRLRPKQLRSFVNAVKGMTALKTITWGCNHAPIEISEIWPSLVECGTLQEVSIRDNFAFHAPSEQNNEDTSDDDKDEDRHEIPKKSKILPYLTALSVCSTRHTYGLPKYPSLSRVTALLHDAPLLTSLTIDFASLRPNPTAPHMIPGANNSNGSTVPSVDSLFLLTRFKKLTSLTLKNLVVGSGEAARTFFSAHDELESLTLELSGAGMRSGALEMPPDSLPRLKEMNASKEIILALLSPSKGGLCSSIEDDAEAIHVHTRPLNTIRGFTLSTPPRDALFLSLLSNYNSTIRRIELIPRGGWADIEDIRRIAACVPALKHLHIGTKRGSNTGPGGGSSSSNAKLGPATNITDWASTLAMMPELETFHGVKFFYEVSPAIISSHHYSAHAPAGQNSSAASSMNLGPSDRSRMRKNDEVANTLGRRCAQLRRLDHWEEGSGKVVTLFRDGGVGNGNNRDVRIGWEVKRSRVEGSKV